MAGAPRAAPPPAKGPGGTAPQRQIRVVASTHSLDVGSLVLPAVPPLKFTRHAGGPGAALRRPLVLLPAGMLCLSLLCWSAAGLASGLGSLPVALAGAARHGLSVALPRRFASLPAQPDTLVVYIYSNTDAQYEANLRYFLRHGVSPPGAGVDYVVVLQEGPDVEETAALPDAPPSVRFVRHPNSCYDWGTFGWALDSGVAGAARYKHVVLLNSSVRGPFLPAHWPAGRHWTAALTGRLTQDVRMVGATISCEPAWEGGLLSGRRRQNPHVQSYLVAMDQVALAELRRDGHVLRCHDNLHDAVWYAELGSSAAVLKAGYNIDSLMLRYQGVDWRDPATWDCNAALNPYMEHMYDGLDLSALEVMFVKVKQHLLEANQTTAAAASRYADWADARLAAAAFGAPPRDLRSNAYVASKAELRLMKTLSMRARGPGCFDFAFYAARNPDVAATAGGSEEYLWEQFVKHGVHEGRIFRFRCPAEGAGAATEGAPALPAGAGLQPGPASGQAVAAEGAGAPPAAVAAAGEGDSSAGAEQLRLQAEAAEAAQRAVQEALVQMQALASNEGAPAPPAAQQAQHVADPARLQAAAQQSSGAGAGQGSSLDAGQGLGRRGGARSQEAAEAMPR